MSRVVFLFEGLEDAEKLTKAKAEESGEAVLGKSEEKKGFEGEVFVWLFVGFGFCFFWNFGETELLVWCISILIVTYVGLILVMAMNHGFD